MAPNALTAEPHQIQPAWLDEWRAYLMYWSGYAFCGPFGPSPPPVRTCFWASVARPLAAVRGPCVPCVPCAVLVGAVVAVGAVGAVNANGGQLLCPNHGAWQVWGITPPPAAVRCGLLWGQWQGASGERVLDAVPQARGHCAGGLGTYQHPLRDWGCWVPTPENQIGTVGAVWVIGMRWVAGVEAVVVVVGVAGEVMRGWGGG